MIEKGIETVYREIELALSESEITKAANLVFPALDQFPNDAQLLFYAAHVLVKNDSYAMAKLACERSIELVPSSPAYGNLGAILRRMNDSKGAEEALDKAIAYNPNDPNSWNNKAANWVNEGNPDPGIAAAEQALKINPEFLKAKWNLGLLQLEKGDFENGWKNYRVGMQHAERMLRNYTDGGDDEPKLLESISQLIEWRHAHGGKPRVIVWGEQGIGDEIMFSTMLPDLAEWADVIFECHPRLIGMFGRSYPFIKEFYPTRKMKDINWPSKTRPAQFKVGIGDLGLFFRNTEFSFEIAANIHSKGFLKPDPVLRDSYRKTLEGFFPGKRFIGVAWTGGVLRTMRWYRSCQLPQLYNLGVPKDVVLVSLQYEDDGVAVQQYIEKTKRDMVRFPGITQAYDYDHTLALVCALDHVVTVCQSVAHLSAAAGQRTDVLVPDKPAWRYGLTGARWYWYGDKARLFRRKGEKWDDAITALEFAHGICPLPTHEWELIRKVPKGERMLELGAKQFGKYKAWFTAKGWDHVCVDLNGEGGALPLDLQKPLELGEFDCVTNFGTSEHVDEQEPCWRNIIEAVKPGGYLISTTPLDGDWPEHGRWYPSKDWYAELCMLNGFKVEFLEVVCQPPNRMVALRAVKKHPGPFVMPSLPIFQNQGKYIKTGKYS